VVVVVVVFVVLVAAAVTPVPVNCTWCRPDPSSPVICHVAVAGPAVVGVKATVSVIVSPGVIVVPSGRAVLAVKAPPNGGFDLLTVTSLPPTFLSVNVLEAVVPTGTAPKSTASPEAWRTPGVEALAERTIFTSPPTLLCSSMLSENAPTCVGGEVDLDGHGVAGSDRVAERRGTGGGERRTREVLGIDLQGPVTDVAEGDGPVVPDT